MLADNSNRYEFTDEEERRMRERAAQSAKEKEKRQKLEQARKAKKQKTIHKISTAFIISLIVVVSISLLFIAANAFGNVTFSKIIDYIKDGIINSETGDGYPLDVGSGSVTDMLMIGDTLVGVQNDEIALFNNTAKKTAAYMHSYSKPMTCVANGRMLVCDRVTGRYMIVNRTETIFESELQSETYACTLAKNGVYAFSTKADGAASIVSVYDAGFSKTFDFKCSDEYIIGLSVSPNGKYIALIGIGSKEAFLYSKLYILDLNKEEVVATFDFEGESLNTVFYSGNNSVVVVSENTYTVIRNNEEVEKNNFGYNTISRFDSDINGNFAIVLSKYGSIDSGAVALFNDKGKELFSLEIDCKIECIDFDGSTVCIVDSDNVVRTYNKRGKLLGETQLESPVQDIAVNGKYCYALCFGTVVQIDVRK